MKLPLLIPFAVLDRLYDYQSRSVADDSGYSQSQSVVVAAVVAGSAEADCGAVDYSYSGRQWLPLLRQLPLLIGADDSVDENSIHHHSAMPSKTMMKFRR